MLNSAHAMLEMDSNIYIFEEVSYSQIVVVDHGSNEKPFLSKLHEAAGIKERIIGNEFFSLKGKEVQMPMTELRTPANNLWYVKSHNTERSELVSYDGTSRNLRPDLEGAANYLVGHLKLLSSVIVDKMRLRKEQAGHDHVETRDEIQVGAV